ncbi:Uncharacterised protein [Staphylococcus aureus]|uniref:Uncharacterized protein n=1 Tax=Staphylococcus aureus TaxID=1280 RepID=A0A380DVJ4_STAAU|nr:Uncharacterised protein [Staphylococcus aureus]
MQLLQKNPMANLGVAGLCQMIKPTVIDWYIGEYNPKPAWMQSTKARGLSAWNISREITH